MTDFIGQTIGQYRIEAPVGTGGMGQVFRGVHKLLDRPAAIKVMHAHLASDAQFRARFLQEAKTAAALRHPNIVEIYEFGEQDGLLYLVMELMTDGSVRTLLQRNAGQPLPLPLGLDLVRQVAEGLSAAQPLHMVHRDIKPDNLLLNRLNEPSQGREQYVLKISDFGLARLAEGSGLTATGFVVGTLAYMSPEQCQSKRLDGRSDLYSLGIVLYEVATGLRPFQIGDFVDALNKHVNVAPRPPREMRPGLPPILEEIILRCLAKRPEERYATATELASALQGALGMVGLETTSSRLPPGQPTQMGKTVLQPPASGGTPAPVVSSLPGPSTVPRVRVLDKSGQTLHVVEVTSRGLVIGREPGNDIALPSDTVSRQHLQVLWDGKQVMVKDLGSSNGTWLGGVRLLPQVSQPWPGQQSIRIEPFWLRLEGTSQTGAPTQATQPSAFSASGTVRTPILSERIGISVTPKTLTITPGQPATVQVTLTNLGSTVDWFTTTVEGVAPTWVQGPGEAIQLNPGMQENVELSVNVARAPNNRAQDYPVTIRARSREKPNESGTTQVRWTVLPFKEDALRLEPRRASGRGGAAYTVALNNGGNTPGHYELSGEDDEQKMAYRFGQNPVNLDPGREARVPLAVSTRRHWLGREQRQPFQVHARPAGSSIPLTTPGEFVNKALIPGWLLPVALVVVAAGVVLASVFGVLPIFGSTSPTPTPIVTAPTDTPTPTPSPNLPADTCIQGYVWREAVSGDHVCVTPETRAQAQYDNSQAQNRIDPNGTYGDSCIQGYVWREAVSDDHVCVTPETRAQAQYDNSQAQSRVKH